MRASSQKTALAIHGGSGTILKEKMTPQMESVYRSVLGEALRCGNALLLAGQSALDAVEAAVRVLEDAHVFNAGRGSVFNSDGLHEMDAAIMCGATLEAGAVAGVTGIKNPISLARKVLESDAFVFLSGEGAESFAKLHDITFETKDYFFTQERYDQLRAAKSGGNMILDHDGESKKFGTVGAVACDREGNLAAATSTGGLTNKRFCRIGDTPVIGAGTYANNQSCAVSCTGYGEPFIRLCVAHDIAARMEYLNESLETAANMLVHEKLPSIAGEGGLIAVSSDGRVALPFNTEGMYRGWVLEDGKLNVEIYGD
jgi:beta-aspartyl-peptidase (threonine type)